MFMQESGDMIPQWVGVSGWLLVETKSPSNNTWLTSALSWRRWSCEMNQPYWSSSLEKV